MHHMELNAGRFHLRPLRHDSRVSDLPALAHVHGAPVTPEYIEDADTAWENDTAYHWAAAEQTCIDLVSEIVVTPVGEDEATVEIRPAGPADTLIEVQDETLVPVTVGDACEMAGAVVKRWTEGALRRTVTVITPQPPRVAD